MAEIRPDGQYMLWDGSDWNILNGPPGANGNMTELWQTGSPAGSPGSRWIDPATLIEYVWNRDTLAWAPLGGGSSGGGSGHALQDEGTLLPTRGSIDFVGGGVTATDDAANNKTIVNVTGLGTGLDQATADSLYVNVAGDAMDGDLYVNADINVTGTVNGTDGIFGTISTTGAVQFGGTTSLVGPTTASAPITLPADPTAALQAATKQYVDTNKGGQPHVIKDENAAALAQRANLRFVGPAVAATDDSAGNSTVVTISTPNIVVLGPSDPIPGGTPVGTIIIRTT